MTSGNRSCIEIRRHQTKGTGQRARQIIYAVSDNYATTRRDRYIRLTQKSNTKCFFFADHVWHVNKALKSAMSGANYVDGVSIMTDWQPLVKRNWLGFETCQNNSASKFTYGVNYVNDIVMAIANERYQFNSLYSMQPRCLVILCKEVEEEGRFVNSKSRKLLYIGSEIWFVFKNSNFNKCLGRNEKPYPDLVMNEEE